MPRPFVLPKLFSGAREAARLARVTSSHARGMVVSNRVLGVFWQLENGNVLSQR